MKLPPFDSIHKIIKDHPVAFLTQSFFKDYDEVMVNFSPSERLEVTEHFMKMMDQLGAFADSYDNGIEPEHSQGYLAATDALLIKYGSKFKPYMDKYFIQYFLFPLVLVTKGYYSAEEAQRGKFEALSAIDGKAFAFICKGILIQKRTDLLTSDAHKTPNEVPLNITTPNEFKEANEPSNAQISPNLLLLIEAQLLSFKDSFNKAADFNHSVQAIAQFLSNGQAYSGEVIFVKGGIIKKLAFALGEIWRSTSNDIISIEYLTLYTQLFSIFSKIEIDSSNLFSNNLYKYSISKT